MTNLELKATNYQKAIDAKNTEYGERKPQLNQLERNIDRSDTNLKQLEHDDAEMQ
jgi:septal ring factor EnvC (AmiA/AmiB activator)